ncbi:hypothetical protein [Kitasatospora phosalacinea]|uniref:Uncharacterized protein n=1 Tax=Kitasatospora phosalacinea TaxID=2065 RepID=A0A9W6UQ40_9ACTN|nr:hypothetical protein [Kitasatospora phosalacinea]GLW58136.1 hypothetical protein Kpho01_61470 [Kitasatospora phosalacinea]
MEIDETFWAGVAALATVAALGLSVWATLQAKWAAQASARTAEEVARIERDRWHRELTPELDFRLVPKGADHWRLEVELTGPAGLDRLDRITLTVRDEAGVDHIPRTPGIDPAEAAAVIWGPVRLQPVVDGVRAPGRESVLEKVERGEPVVRAIDATAAPSWYQLPDWRERNKDLPLRLHAVCEYGEHRPWIVVVELPVPTM